MLIRALVLVTALICATTSALAQDTTPPTGLNVTVPEAPTGRLERILRRRELIVGVKSDYPPWGMINADGDLEGLEIDLATDLARRLGVTLSLVAVTSNNRNARVNSGVVDVVIATVGDTEERRLQADHILPNYYSSGVVVYSRADQALGGWDDVRDQRLCLNRGAFYNRTLEDDYGANGLYFSGTRESRLALLQGRCIGWAFDDTALAQLIVEDARRADLGKGATTPFEILDDAILVTPWAIVVEKGEGQGDLGRFLSDAVAVWHGSGRIIALQQKWGIPVSDYIVEKNEKWSAVDGTGRAICARDVATDAFSQDCLASDPFKRPPAPVIPDWMQSLKSATGIDLAAFVNDANRARLMRGLWLTLGLGAVAIIGALSIGITFAMLDGWLNRLGLLGQILVLPQKALITVAQMTPPILQLYIVYFGLTGTFADQFNFTPGNFVIAAVILSMYAGATNAVLLGTALAQERRAHPDRTMVALLPQGLARAFDGLVAACINIVKAAGMASAIAVSEVISTINLLVAEGADTATLMNGLLIFYFFLVLAIIWGFRLLRSAFFGNP